MTKQPNPFECTNANLNSPWQTLKIGQKNTWNRSRCYRCNANERITEQPSSFVCTKTHLTLWQTLSIGQKDTWFLSMMIMIMTDLKQALDFFHRLFTFHQFHNPAIHDGHHEFLCVITDTVLSLHPLVNLKCTPRIPTLLCKICENKLQILDR